MPEIIKREDTPVAVVHDPLNTITPYIILDVNGGMRAQFAVREEADAFAEAVNAPPKKEEPELKEEDEGDTADEHDQEDHEQQEDEDMPTGIPNKKKKVKAAVKKRAGSARATVRTGAKKRAVSAVKKAVKKTKKKKFKR